MNENGLQLTVSHFFVIYLIESIFSMGKVIPNCDFLNPGSAVYLTNFLNFSYITNCF